MDEGLTSGMSITRRGKRYWTSSIVGKVLAIVEYRTKRVVIAGPRNG